MQIFKNILLFITLAIASLSCDSYTDPLSTRAPTLILTEEPTVTGIWMSDVVGNSLGAWGNPAIPDTSDEYSRVYGTPNPVLEAMTFSFMLPKQSNTRVFIVRAHLAGTQEINSVGGAVMAESKDIIVRTFPPGTRPAGEFSFTWDGMDDDGRRLPTGFYRIYVVTQQRVMFFDIYFANSREEFLPGMPGKN
ncbi:MAG: FlgD immunoglobulin-like domain containing protein [Bacteroidota bacterium]